MKKVTSKSIRTGQTVYAIGWHGFDPARGSGLPTISEYYVFKMVIGSNKIPYPEEGCVVENPVNLKWMKERLAFYEKRPEARVKFWYSRRRAQRSGDLHN